MHSRLEQYLTTVEQNLHAVSADERDNELREIRLHIESLVASHQELGSTEEEAVSRTLAQFGQAQTLGKDLTHVHHSGGRAQFHLLAGAIAFNYFCGMLASTVTSRIVPIPLIPSVTFVALWYLRGMITTFSIGWLSGIVVPRHAVKGTLYAHLLGMGISVGVRLLLPARSIPPMPILGSWLFLVPAFTVATALAMYGAKRGAQSRSTRKVTMRLVR